MSLLFCLLYIIRVKEGCHCWITSRIASIQVTFDSLLIASICATQSMRRLSTYNLLMACASPSLSVESHEEDSPTGQSTATSPRTAALNQRRRHSSYHSLRRLSYDLDAEATFVKVHPHHLCKFCMSANRNSRWIYS